ncbi:hypothetical protein LO763_00275 [Glycomyces sp. A-F 0318]|uniref:hypothetical protein n=1 Tax=Glycomyces amatae TaxID=2881355 RepID=UPI001E2BFAC5|nr:hypothetical protein [Glycomyces amatae]MCD0442062.1 hypothetical protein [Glycomyces amatae]
MKTRIPAAWSRRFTGPACFDSRRPAAMAGTFAARGRRRAVPDERDPAPVPDRHLVAATIGAMPGYAVDSAKDREFDDAVVDTLTELLHRGLGGPRG